MSGPPPPPKRNNRKPTNVLGAGPGHNVARILSNPAVPETSMEADHYRFAKICLLDDVPDSRIGNGVEIHGEFQFDRLLQLDGKFQGKLLSSGDLIVGKNGCLIGDVNTIKRMIVDGGNVVGNISVDELVLRGTATIKGNITCKLLEIIGTEVTICGRANVHPLAPELVDKDDNIISAVAKKPRKVVKPFPPAIVAPEIEIAEQPMPIVLEETPMKKVETKPIASAPSPVKYAKAQPDTSDAEAAAVAAAISKHIQIKNERKEQKKLAAEQKAAKKAGKEKAPKSNDTPPITLPPVKTGPDAETSQAVLQDFSQELSVNEHGPKVVVECPAPVSESTLKYTDRSPAKTTTTAPVAPAVTITEETKDNVPSELVGVSLNELAAVDNSSKPTDTSGAKSTKSSPAKAIHLPPSPEQREMQAQLDAEASKKQSKVTDAPAIVAEPPATGAAEEVTTEIAPADTLNVAEEKTPLEWGNDSAVLEPEVAAAQSTTDDVNTEAPPTTQPPAAENTQPATEHKNVEHSTKQPSPSSKPVKTLKDLQAEFTTLADDVLVSAENDEKGQGKGDFMQQAINSEV